MIAKVTAPKKRADNNSQGTLLFLIAVSAHVLIDALKPTRNHESMIGDQLSNSLSNPESNKEIKTKDGNESRRKTRRESEVS